VGCLRRLGGCLFGTIAALVIIVAAAYLILLYYMESQLADAVRRKFMLPPSSTVNISTGDIVDSLSGRVESVLIKSPEASVSGIRVENLEFYAEDLSFDVVNLVTRKNPVLKEVVHAEASFTVSPQDLANAWLERAHRFGVRDLTVEFGAGGGGKLPPVTVTARTTLLGKDLAITGRGRFKLAGQKDIVFFADEIELEKLNLGRDLVEALFERIAPRLRIEDFQGDLVIERLQVKDGKLHVAAQAAGIANLGDSANTQHEEDS